MVYQEQSNPRQSHTNLHTAVSFPGGAEAVHRHCPTPPGGGGGVAGTAKRGRNWDSKEVDVTGDKLSVEDFSSEIPFLKI